MDSYSQILCRLQKSKQKVPPLLLPCTKKTAKKHFFEFLVQGSDGGGTFRLLFLNL